MKLETFYRSIFALSAKHLFIKARSSLHQSEGDGQNAASDDAKLTTTVKGSMGERIAKALAKVEEKKKKRAARKAQVYILHTMFH